MNGLCSKGSLYQILKASKLIVKKLMQAGVQFVVTTHNTSLMSNDLLRPDCYYLMGNNLIKLVSQCTDKEFHLVHNIENIYKGGGFYVRHMQYAFVF